MNRKIIISPSVLSLDFSQVNVQMEQLNKSQAAWIHYDVMDGNFVPNITFGPYIMEGLKKLSSKFFDVHLMVTNPELFAQAFIDAKADCITFHYEALADRQSIINLATKIRKNHIMAGISIKPDTPVTVLDDLLEYFDLVLIMSVEPGFGGQKFNPAALEKISYLRETIDKRHLKTLIEVDGGINKETVALCKQHGIDVVVAGSYVFKGDICQRVEDLL